MSDPTRDAPTLRGKGPGRLRPGRPKKLNKPWRKVTVVLSDDQIVFLDRKCADIRARTGAPMRRTELIRAFIDAVQEAELDVTDTSSEADVREVVEDAIRSEN